MSIIILCDRRMDGHRDMPYIIFRVCVGLRDELVRQVRVTLSLELRGITNYTTLHYSFSSTMGVDRKVDRGSCPPLFELMMHFVQFYEVKSSVFCKRFPPNFLHDFAADTIDSTCVNF